MTTNLTVHRLLDEAFAGIAPTEASRDLKEELRASLVARVEELEASGAAPNEAARRALEELGDISALIDDAPAGSIHTRNRVRPNAAFVVRAVLLPLLAAITLGLAILVAVLGGPAAWIVVTGLVLAVALLLGAVTADALHQETSSHYPMPGPRAIGFGGGTALLLAGVGLTALWWEGALPWYAWIAAGVVLVLAGIGLLAGLGATNTNRTKPWAMRESARHQGAADRFERDPNAAARFGIYTMLIWVGAAVAAVIVGFTAGWWWAAIPAIGGFAAMMLLLTRMLFASERGDR